MRILVLFLLLAGCAAKPTVLPPPPLVSPVIIHPSSPTPVELEAPQFYVLTPNNIDKFFEREGVAVVFAVSTDGYESLALNIQELRRYINELQGVVLYYKTSIEEYEKVTNDAR